MASNKAWWELHWIAVLQTDLDLDDECIEI
jgi:hypothetical protein